MPDKRPHRHRRRTARKRWMCDRKVAYPSQYLAMRAGCSVGMNWYRCPYCHKWHLTKRGTSGLVV